MNGDRNWKPKDLRKNGVFKLWCWGLSVMKEMSIGRKEGWERERKRKKQREKGREKNKKGRKEGWRKNPT